MRNAFRAAFLPGNSGLTSVRPWRLAIAALLILLLVACQTAPPEPTPTETELEFDLELELSLLDLPVNEAHRVRFLPPLARSLPTGQFVNDMELEVRFFNVNPNTSVASGASLGTTLSTAKRTVLSQRGTFATVFLSLTMALDRKATEYIRAEVRVPGAPNSPVCNQPSDHCLGYLDIYVFKGLFLNRNKIPAGFVPIPALLGVLPIGFKVLEEQAPPVGGPPPTTISELQGVSGGPLSESLGNCTSSFLTRPGQGLQAVGAGLQAVGAVGGMFMGATAAYPSSLIEPAQVGIELADYLARRENLGATALLVVDDFRAGYELPAQLFQANPDLEALATDISHGALVLHHLRQLASAMLPGAVWTEGLGPNGQPYYLLEDGFAGVYLQVVDVGNYNTDEIPGQIRAVLAEYAESSSPYGPRIYDVVVNMSFAIVPCAVLYDYEAASGINTFEDYLQALAEVNEVGGEYLPQLDELVSIPVDLSRDPLLAYLACPLPSVADGQPVCDGSGPGDSDWGPFSALYHVASSGNYGGPYALYPAASPYVVSVGSLERETAEYATSDYSNVAEIAAPGGLFELATVGGQTVAYAGTSFAAPAVSMFLAIDLMSPRAGCGPLDPGQVPALADGRYSMLPFYLLSEEVYETGLFEYCVRPF